MSSQTRITIQDWDEYDFKKYQGFIFYNFLLNENDFKDISHGAKILYSLLRERNQLSLENNFVDSENNIYVIYTVEQISKKLNCTKTTAIKFKKELRDVGLIDEIKDSNNNSLIYVKIPN